MPNHLCFWLPEILNLRTRLSFLVCSVPANESDTAHFLWSTNTLGMHLLAAMDLLQAFLLLHFYDPPYAFAVYADIPMTMPLAPVMYIKYVAKAHPTRISEVFFLPLSAPPLKRSASAYLCVLVHAGTKHLGSVLLSSVDICYQPGQLVSEHLQKNTKQ